MTRTEETMAVPGWVLGVRLAEPKVVVKEQNGLF